jgi:hypothetical protein
MQVLFGIGALWGQRTDVANIGPDQFAILQDNTIDFSWEVKELYSQLSFPVDIARGKGKITGKAKAARVFAALYADIFFGEAVVSGESTVSEDEVFTLATTGIYTVANATGFAQDLGLYYNSNSRGRFKFVTGAPTTGQYTTGVNGVYTFNTGDANQSLAISYIYTNASGFSVTIKNELMGYTPTFLGTFYSQNATLGTTGQLTLRLNECVSSRLSFPSRIDDYNIPDLDFSVFSSGSNIIGTLSSTE